MSTLLPTLALLAAGLGASTGPAPQPAELRHLAAQNNLLAKELALAKGKEFYLLADPAGKTLKLLYRGALLQQYKVDGIEVGVPQVAFRSRVEPGTWEGRVWENGALDPPRALDRIEIQAPPPTPEGTEIPAVVPPTPEEKYPVPPRYHIRFAGGLSIEVRTPGPEARRGFWGRMAASLAAWWDDAKAAASSSPTDTLRLHLSMPKQDAESLYRALPPETKLLVVPQTP
jgi:hypothetical protein